MSEAANNQAPATLAELRVQIDAIDGELLTLLNRRAKVAEQVGEIKRREGSPFFRPDRVAQVISVAAALSVQTTAPALLNPRGQAVPPASTTPGLGGAPCLKAWHHLVIQADGRAARCLMTR